MTPIVELRGVSVTVGARNALDGVTLALDAGEVLAVAGPSGSGKTTLLGVIAGLTAPTRGLVALGGREAGRDGRLLIPPEERGVGMVFQDLALWPHLTVAENVAFALSAQGIAAEETRRRVAEALLRVGLTAFADRAPRTLSGGEQQRVAIARALVTEPALLLFDEPFSGLDVVTHADVVELVGGLLAERGAAAVCVTHDPREARRLATRLAVLEAGRLVQIGSFDELEREPRTDFVKLFVASAAGGPRRAG